MNNPKILYTDLSKYTFSATEDTKPDYPLANLNNYVTTLYWEPNSLAGNQSLIIDMGEPVDATAFVIDGHNFQSIAVNGIVVESSNLADFSVSTVLSNLDIPEDDVTIYETFAKVTHRYYRIRVYNDFETTQILRIGNVFIGVPMEFTTPYNFGYKSENAEYSTTEKVSLSGIRRSIQAFKGRLVNELEFTFQSTAFRTEFQNFVKTVRGKLYPFYFIDTDDTVRYMNLENDYQPVSVPKYGYSALGSIVMKTNQSTY